MTNHNRNEAEHHVGGVCQGLETKMIENMRIGEHILRQNPVVSES